MRRVFRLGLLLKLGLLLALGTLSVLAFAAPAEGAQKPEEGEAARLLAVIRNKGDRTSDSVFRALGQLGDRAAFNALRAASRHVSTPWSLQRVYEAFRYLEEPPELRTEAIAFLAQVVLKRESLHRIGAVRGLVAIGPAAARALLVIAEEGEPRTCREIAVGALLTELQVRRTPADLELILDAYRFPTSGPRIACVRALRSFDSKACLAVFARAIVDSELDAQARTMAIDALEEMPGAAVDEMLTKALSAAGDAVRLAALEALGERGYQGHGPELERLERSRSPAVARAAFLAQIDLRPDDDGWLRRMLRAAREKDVEWRAAAATALAHSRQARAHEELFRLATDRDVRVRGSAIEGLAGLRSVAAIAALVERMELEEGYLRGAARNGLVRLTGEDHGLSPARWRQWWDAQGPGFVLPTLAEALARHLERERARTGRTTKSTTFFGVTIEEKAVCFVLDVSSSMKESGADGATRLQLVERELRAALERYEDGRLFNLILFASGVRVWRDKLVVMDADERARALRYIARQNPRGETALYDALVTALEDSRVEALVLLSDGAPTAGRLRDEKGIVKDILKRVRKRNIAIHCVSVARSSPILEALAIGSGGEYHVIE